MTSLPVQKQALHTPSLEEVSDVLQKGLRGTFAEATCEVVQCPDLTQSPWGLAAEGLGGSPCIGELGGVRFLSPLPNKDKVYDMKELGKLVDLPDGLIIGAGAGPFPYTGVNCEMIPNLKIGNPYKNESRVVTFSDKDPGYRLEKLPLNESRCAILLNFFASKGTKGQVLKISAKKRIGDDDFVGCMRKALENKYGSRSVGIGGTFLMQKGQAKLHVMPDFSKTPLNTDEEVNQWLKYFTMKAPLLFMSVFVSRDPGFEFRLEHTHGYSDTEGGHYHYDTTPDQVEYEGYFNVAELIYRIDRPPKL